MEAQNTYDDIFTIPYQEGQYLIYMPFKQIILMGNTGLVNLINKANNGDQEALQQLGVSLDFFRKESEFEQQIKSPPNLDDLPSFAPTSVSLFLTNNCPLRCRYCYADGGKNKLKMPWNTVTGVLDEVLNNVLKTNMGHLGVSFHGGGDVTSAWNLLVQTKNYISAITKPHAITYSTTIGLSGILNERQRDWIVNNISGATVSLDGDPTNNKHRPLANGKDSFPLVHKTLKAFDKAKFNYGLRCTVTEDTVNKMDSIIRFFCENYEVSTIKIEPMFPAGRANGSSIRSPNAVSFVENYRKAYEIAKSYNRNLVYSGARFNTLSNVFCQAAGESCAVTPEGWITSCYEVLSEDNPFAGVFFYGKFNQETKRMEINEEIRKNQFKLTVHNSPKCQSCFCKWHCAGDCPVKSKQMNEMPSDEYPDRCYINRELTKDQLLETISEAYAMSE